MQQSPLSWDAKGAKPAPPPSDLPSILLVDDHAINRMVVRTFLDPVGLEVVEAVTGEDAVDRYRERAFDVVLMDLRMPVMDGIAATREIRAREAARAGHPRPSNPYPERGCYR